MPDIIIQSARLVPYAKRPKQGSGYVHVYSHEPEPDSPAAQYGHLYVVSEALVGGRASEDLIDIIIETFGDQYYNHAGDHPFALARFENAVKATNRELAAHVDRGNASWIGKLSSIIAVIVDNEVHVAHTGSAEGLLARGKAAHRITSDEPARPATPTKTFGSIASGELEVNDRLLFCTPALVHHVPLAKLSSVLRHNSPSSAISELTALLKGSPQDRVGAVVCEVTTPELAAMQLRSEQPSEIALGAPENALQAAKLAAAPLAESTVSTGQKLKSASVTAYRQAQPYARRAGLAIAAGIRRVLRERWGRYALMAALVLIIIGIIATADLHVNQQHAKDTFTRYQRIYRDFQSQQTASGPTAIGALQQLQSRLKQLEPQTSVINQQLANSELLDHEPTSFAAFAKSLADRLDQLSGLQSRAPVLLKDLATSGQTISFMEPVGPKIVVVATGKTPTILLINPTTASVTDSRVNLAQVGTIVATAASANNDGVYLLTSAPSVWFYATATDTLTPQSVTFGGWPTGAAIASYASSLYILSGDTIYKFVKSATGYSPRSVYTTLSGSAAGAKTLAVDGSVYTLNRTGLTEFLAGAVQASPSLPTAMDNLVRLRSYSSGKVITAVNPTTNRVVVFESASGKLQFTRQLAPHELSQLTDAAYDPATGNVWLLAGNRVFSIGLTR
ncbi:MAG TPA: hypothetical protein VI322_01365 [Candidatus Saccharimonadia bacterium]